VFYGAHFICNAVYMSIYLLAVVMDYSYLANFVLAGVRKLV